MLRIYNSQSRKKEDFIPVEKNKVKMYVCGPTVYNRIHIGNARTFISFDIIRRYLLWRKMDVTFVQNITDVDDKIIEKANNEGVDAAEIAKKYTTMFIEDMHKAGVLDPDVRPKATEEIQSMIDLVKNLIDNGHAYENAGDVYFDVESYKGYGCLSGRNYDDAQSGHRQLRSAGQGLEDRKNNSADFALWKAAKPGEPAWDSPWGKGRPGWHIECSAMSHKYLGLPFDIHGGGNDLIFPHHENERAQSVCGFNCDFANYWMHTGMLQITNKDTGEAEKMSKSLNNFLLLHDVLEHFPSNVLRILVLQSHYRSPLVFGTDRLEEASSAWKKITNSIKDISWRLDNLAEKSKDDLNWLRDEAVDLTQNFMSAMDDDFNTSKALGEIFASLTSVNSKLPSVNISETNFEHLKKYKDTIIELISAFGLNCDAISENIEHFSQNLNRNDDHNEQLFNIAKKYSDFCGSDRRAALDALLNARCRAREQKQWDIADGIRDALLKIGLKIEDTPQGPRITS